MTEWRRVQTKRKGFPILPFALQIGVKSCNHMFVTRKGPAFFVIRKSSLVIRVNH